MRRFFSRFSGQDRQISPPLEEEDSKNNVDTKYRQDHEELTNWPVTSEADIAELSVDANLSVEFASDPNAWELQMEKSWSRLEELLESKFEPDSIGKVHAELSIICRLLIMEVSSQSEPSIGPILDQFFNEEILLCVQKWALKVPQYAAPKCQVMMIRLYEYMVNCSQSPQSLLVHKPILFPLMQLLYWYRKSAEERLRTTKTHRPMATVVDLCFVRLINQICRKIAEDTTLLHFFFNSSVSTPRDGIQTENGASTMEEGRETEDGVEKPFLVFDFLVPYLYAPEDVGQFTRDALLLIMSVSKGQLFVADYVAQKSNFCPVLAAGLSGCFSQLPHCIFTELGIDLEGFHKLSSLDVKTLPELYEFHSALLFCNAVGQISHPTIVNKIVSYFYGGFLLEVFKSSVLESDSAEELCSRIVYFHLCLDTCRTPPLVHALVKVLLVADTGTEHEGMNLLEVLLARMNTDELLCRVTLSLLRTLLELRCEDLLWSVVFRYLIPFIPLKTSMRGHNSRRFDVNVSLNAASFFLQSIPKCTRSVEELNSEQQFELYLREAAEAIDGWSVGCSSWKFKYDGTMPNSVLPPITTEEPHSARQVPFVRHGSARSSFASTGWNRYFQSRSTHGTLLDGNMDTVRSLNELGQEDKFELMREEDLLNCLNGGGTSSSQEDFSDFNPQYNERLDYFHFAYEGISESDPDSASSRRNSHEEQREGRERSQLAEDQTSWKTTKEADAQSSDLNSPGKPCSTLMDQIRKTEWAAAKKIDDFIALLDELPCANREKKQNDKSGMVEESIALIEARWQHLQELNREKETLKNKSGDEENPFHLDISGSLGGEMAEEHRNYAFDSGLPLECVEDRGAGILIESLFETLNRLPQNSFSTNIQLMGVLNVLLSYPQPLLTTYFLYVDVIKSLNICRITNLIRDLKSEIDAYASEVVDFEHLLSRGLRHKQARAERSERSQQFWRNGETNGNNSASTRSTSSNGGGGFHFSHRQIALDQSQEDYDKQRNYVYAAIVHSQICQLMAAFALQHCTSAEYSRSR